MSTKAGSIYHDEKDIAVNENDLPHIIAPDRPIQDWDEEEEKALV